MDELKKYLQENRMGMDADLPPANMWQRIKKEEAVQKPGSKIIRISFRFAAAACVLAIIFFGVKWMITDTTTTTPTAINNSFPVKIQNDSLQKENVAVQLPHDTISVPVNRNKNAEPTPDALLEDFQRTYGSIVKMQLNSIRHTPVLGEEPGYFNDFKSMLNQMDIDEGVIKRNMKANGVTAQLLEQLINVYQQKLDVLKSLHTEIDKMNSKIKQNHPLPDSLNVYYINI
jgi:hypothetical protein